MSKSSESKTFRRLNAMLRDIDEGGKQIIKNLQFQMDYLLEKVQILEEIIFEHTGKETVSYSDKQKKRLAVKGKQLNEFLLGEIETGFAPGTILGWYRQLVGRKYNSVGQNQKKRGRKPVSPEIVDKTLELAKMNPSWGYERIAGVLVYLGFEVTAFTVRKILDDYGIVPDPEKRSRGDWDRFMRTQEAVTAATDFAQTEVVYPFGLVRYSSLFFMDCKTREVRLGGIAHNPTSQWTMQVARNMCDMIDGFLLGKKYLIHDRDVLFNQPFDSVFESIGITIKKLPPYSPSMNARMENFIRALKLECLDKIVFQSPEQLRYAINQFLEYWNHYRPHAGLDGKMVKPYEQDPDGRIMEIPFLGGLLHGYRREKKVA